ncbi:Tubulointerstitial nephritis antigen-like [Frankliniella fusca]|uniref:Tubulointerstitial nephritis antigen-like n=1 Tax=Frankliniella fusca TaxID=407009 RepID=A0AAE1LF00_9NEOP|nr:Tubulointerstitial nephritis antigen-like [Frankliniella fusca]
MSESGGSSNTYKGFIGDTYIHINTLGKAEHTYQQGTHSGKAQRGRTYKGWPMGSTERYHTFRARAAQGSQVGSVVLGVLGPAGVKSVGGHTQVLPL